MSLNLTKKTYYALGMLGAGCAMAQAIASFSGFGINLLDQLSYMFTGLMFLFLASMKGTQKADKSALFGCFLLLVGSIVLPIALVHYSLVALVWPCFALYEKRKDERLALPTRSICMFEAIWLAARVLVSLGGVRALAIPANLVGLVCAILHGWLALNLYRRERDEA